MASWATTWRLSVRRAVGSATGGGSGGASEGGASRSSSSVVLARDLTEELLDSVKFILGLGFPYELYLVSFIGSMGERPTFAGNPPVGCH